MEITKEVKPFIKRGQARAEGGAEGAWAPAPLLHDAQSALLSRQIFFFFFFY